MLSVSARKCVKCMAVYLPEETVKEIEHVISTRGET